MNMVVRRASQVHQIPQTGLAQIEPVNRKQLQNMKPTSAAAWATSSAERERFRHGAVMAGTSAGASAMSSHMIAFGASGATPKHRMAQIAAGLGMLPGVIVDQHFQQRNRLGRLLSLIAQNPSLLGLGVDEDTAGVVGPDHVMEVIGRGSITVVDGSASETDAWEIRGHKPLMISGVVLHSLPAGYRFDLRRRHRLATPTLHAIQGGGEAASS
jgi:cyanophycinase